MAKNRDISHDTAPLSANYVTFVVCLRAGKNEYGDNTSQHVIENEDNLIPQCKEDWEDSWTPPVAVPDHIPPATVTQEQTTKPSQTAYTNTGTLCTVGNIRSILIICIHTK